MKYIGIVGTRKRSSTVDYDLLINSLEKIYQDGDSIVSGGCKQGSDSFAKDIHLRSDEQIPLIEYLPDLQRRDNLIKEKNIPHRGAHAIVCYERNNLIADKSDYLIACVSKERKGGTEDTIKKFLKKINMKEPDAIASGRLIIV
jgi:hypothetical protein